MKSKSGDVPYCGANQERIENVTPTFNQQNLEYFKEWINDRYDIHVKKDVLNLPAPWTDNPILQKVKFTNVRREHDRTTVWLIKNIAEAADLTLRDKIINMILFRLYNKFETAEILKLPIQFQSFDDATYDALRDYLMEYADANPDYVWFTSAFNTGGMKSAAGRLTGEKFIPMRPIALLLAKCTDESFVTTLMNAEKQSDVVDKLMSVSGIGEFLAYQMFVDFTYIADYKFSENHYTVAGPGCRMGIDMLFDDKCGMSYEDCIFYIRDNQDQLLNIDCDKVFCDLEPHDRVMNVMSLENCFCEFSKYVRCKQQIADGKNPRARVSYDGLGEKPKMKTIDRMKDEPKANYFGRSVSSELLSNLEKVQAKLSQDSRHIPCFESNLFEPKPDYTFDYEFDWKNAKRKFFQIMGTNGSGKTTIPKGLVSVDPDSYVINREVAYIAGSSLGNEILTRRINLATICPNLGIAMIGDYSPRLATGGCDMLVRATMESIITHILNNPEYEGFSIIMEGAILSSSRWQIERFRDDEKIEPVLLFLDTPYDVCIERLHIRNGADKKPNTKNVMHKWEEGRRKYKKCYDGTGGFHGVNPMWVDHSMSKTEIVEWFVGTWL